MGVVLNLKLDLVCTLKRSKFPSTYFYNRERQLLYYTILNIILIRIMKGHNY